MRIGAAVMLGLMWLGCGSTMSPDGGTSGGGHFTYTFDDRVWRIEARVGASPEDVSAKLARLRSGTRDRWLIPSSNGDWLVLSTDRVICSLGECLALTPRDFSSLALVLPGGKEVSLEGTPAVTNTSALVVFPSREGPHEVDLWVTKQTGATWTEAVLLTGSSTYAYNNNAALTFDEQRVLFDCGAEPYPESGNNDACEVKLDGSGFRVVVRPNALPNSVNTYVQFPHDSLDGVLFQGNWPIDGDQPETIWLVKSGAPTPIGRQFTNAVSPCGLRDGRWGMLWLSREGNVTGAHELALAARDGSILGALTPNVDVSDIGIGCSE